jgi:hypothetical protein
MMGQRNDAAITGSLSIPAVIQLSILNRRLGYLGNTGPSTMEVCSFSVENINTQVIKEFSPKTKGQILNVFENTKSKLSKKEGTLTSCQVIFT